MDGFLNEQEERLNKHTLSIVIVDDPSQAELVILHLREFDVDRDDDIAPHAVSIAGIGEALGISRDRMAEWMGLMSTLSNLAEDGHVDERVGKVEEYDEKRTTYGLTESGKHMADTCFERLEDASITVHETGVDREVSLRSIPEEYPDLTMAEALANRSPDGTLYLTSDVERGFVGREAERERLLELLSAVEAGDSRVAFVSGEGDVGKTSLVENLLEEAHTREVEVLTGTSEAEVVEPYQPIRDAITSSAIAGPDAITALEHDRVTVDDANEYAAQRKNLLYRLGREIVGDEHDPRVLFVDDVHQADHATIDFLVSLVDDLDAESLLVVCTYRPDALAGDNYASTLLDEHEDSVEHIELTPFGPEETRQLIESVLGKRGVPDGFVDMVQNVTGGIPLYVEELVSQLHEDGIVDPVTDMYPTSIEELDVPADLTETVARRLDGLDETYHEVLETVAVCGESAAVSLLEAVTTQPAATVREQLDLLIRAGILAERPGGVRFVSTLFRQTVLETAASDRLEAIHERIAETLETADAEPVDDHPASIAFHYARAGAPERAIEFYVLAAETAREVYAHDEAVEYYNEALHIARQHHEEEVLAILEAIGDILTLSGDVEEMMKHFQYVVERTTDPEQRRRAYCHLSHAEWIRGNFERALSYAETGLDVDGPSPSPEEVRLLDRKGEAYRQLVRYDEAEAVYHEMERLAERLDDQELISKAHQRIAWLNSAQGDQDAAISRMERAIDVIERTDDKYQMSDVSGLFGVIYAKTGDLHRAIEHQSRALELADSIDALHLEKMISNNLGFSCALAGLWDEAMECYERVSEIARKTGDRQWEILGMANKAWVLFHTDALAAAREHYEKALEIIREIGGQTYLAFQLPRFGRVLLYAAEIDEAKAACREARSIATECNQKRELTAAYGVLGEVERESGELEAAIESFEQSLSLVRDVGPVSQQLDSLAGYATTLLDAGRKRAALEHAAEAVTHPWCDQYAYHGNRARLVEAQCLIEWGSLDAAEERLETLLDEAADGSNIIECEVRLELGRLACDRHDIDPDESHRIAARNHFQSAHELASEINAHLLVDRSQRGLERLGE